MMELIKTIALIEDYGYCSWRYANKRLYLEDVTRVAKRHGYNDPADWLLFLGNSYIEVCLEG